MVPFSMFPEADGTKKTFELPSNELLRLLFPDEFDEKEPKLALVLLTGELTLARLACCCLEFGEVLKSECGPTKLLD